MTGVLTLAIRDVLQEIRRGVGLHGPLPRSLARAYMILAEEHGELTQAVVDATRPGHVYTHEDAARLLAETTQVAAVAIRLIANLYEGVQV